MTESFILAYPRPVLERRAFVLLALLGLLAVRMISLVVARTDLFFDEAQYWTWSQDLAFGYFSKPPLIAWIIAGFTSICGDGEACVRAAAPIFYFGTSILLFFCARELFDERIALASALVFATLPGVSFSSTQMSTDVPLLFFYSLALLVWLKLLKSRSLTWGALLGAALGLGVLAKYAMLYFLLGAAVHLAVSREARRQVPLASLILATAIAGLMVAPHILWNYQNGFVTFGHTVSNASWGWDFIHPVRLLEFLGAQFGVFGPLLFGALIVIAWRALRHGANRSDTLLLSFSIPVLILICIQAFVSRAYANWAATAYPAATILVTAALLHGGWTRLFRLSLGLHIAVALAMAVAPVFAPKLNLPGNIDPFSRQLGWRETAEMVRGELSRHPYTTILSEDRSVTAELLYYLRDSDIPLAAWQWSEIPDDHYQFQRPFRGANGDVLLVTTDPDMEPLTSRFASSALVREESIGIGPGRSRKVQLYRLEAFKGYSW